MKCPTCVDTDLVMADRQGVEIDYCPKCRGVWLDRGELDKIIERSSQSSPSRRDDDDWDDDDKYKYGKKKSKTKSFFGEIFDF
jgi:Zn-finger nucleic acid-binding protein